MKLRNLVWFATGAGISYQLVKNRVSLQKEINETKLLSEGIQANLSKIQKHLEIIQEQKENVNELLTDFSYKTRIFSKQASVALEQIQDIWSEKSVGKN